MCGKPEKPSSWNTSAVTSMYGVFNQVTSLNGGISSWKTSAVTSVAYMFYGATAFNQDLSSWCVQNNFNSEPSSFKTSANNTWANDASKQPDWDGASCPP
ncbi:BspA family leucine-rich repeat surface protein [Flavobacteriaceae bacterium]|nr:BspA family leucine-rich repeat surface protein [Flavobacteriaceae bacterium]